jgi:hypothetical protein
MITERKQYYQEMIKKDRLMPIIINGKLAAFITFYITNNENEYDDIDSWAVLDNNENGHIVCIRQMITDRNPYNHNFAFHTFRSFRQYIKNKFPSVNLIIWRRYNFEQKVVKTYKKGV